MNNLKLIITFGLLLNIMACEENNSPGSPHTFSIFLNIKAEGKTIFEHDQYSPEKAGLISLNENDDPIHYDFNEGFYFDSRNYFVLQEASQIPNGVLTEEDPLLLDFGNGDVDSIWIFNSRSDKALFENYSFFIEYTEVYYNNKLVELYDFRDISKDSLSVFVNRNEGEYANGYDNPVVIEVEKELEVSK